MSTRGLRATDESTASGFSVSTSRPVRPAAVRIIACIEDPAVIEKHFAHLDAKALEPDVPLRPPCRAPPQRELFDETG